MTVIFARKPSASRQTKVTFQSWIERRRCGLKVKKFGRLYSPRNTLGITKMIADRSPTLR